MFQKPKLRGGFPTVGHGTVRYGGQAGCGACSFQGGDKESYPKNVGMEQFEMYLDPSRGRGSQDRCLRRRGISVPFLTPSSLLPRWLRLRGTSDEEGNFRYDYSASLKNFSRKRSARTSMAEAYKLLHGEEERSFCTGPQECDMPRNGSDQVGERGNAGALSLASRTA
jgi:hypothetical protein